MHRFSRSTGRIKKKLIVRKSSLGLPLLESKRIFFKSIIDRNMNDLVRYPFGTISKSFYSVLPFCLFIFIHLNYPSFPTKRNSSISRFTININKYKKRFTIKQQNETFSFIFPVIYQTFRDNEKTFSIIRTVFFTKLLQLATHL